MMIIIGLGNPGDKFKYTRHNTGFATVDFFAKKNNFPEFKLSKKYNSLISEKEIEKPATTSSLAGEWCGGKIILAKPQTFMNESGKAIASILKNQKEAVLIVIHDDIDLPLGKIKFSKDSGAGGHKGVDSIITNLGKKDFVRLKIGIGNNGEKIKAEKIVLKKFTKEEKEELKSIIEKSTDALDFFIENGLEKTMNEYN